MLYYELILAIYHETRSLAKYYQRRCWDAQQFLTTDDEFYDERTEFSQ